MSVVSISNDDAGRLTFSISVVNYAYFGPGDSLSIFIDTDLNTANGSSGAEYGIVLDGSSNSISLARWTGAAWDFSAPQNSLSSSTYYGAVIKLDRSELGSPAAINLWVGTMFTDSSGSNHDFAPDAGWLNYSVVMPPPPVTVAPAPAPAPVAAPTPTPAPAATPEASATRAPDTALHIPVATAKLRAFVVRKIRRSPRYGRLRCRRQDATTARCIATFSYGVITVRGVGFVQNYLDGDKLMTEVIFDGSRTNTACLRLKKKQGKPIRVCTRRLAW